MTKTSLGAVRGTLVQTASGTVEAYLGIPYAAATHGPGRFRAPTPGVPWRGIRDADEFGPAAPQAGEAWPAVCDGVEPIGDERECLNLNVWTPASDDGGRPVMLWVHGGGYQGGSNAAATTLGAELAAASDVVVVAANYRLGALGFLALDHVLGADYQDAANLGMLDQIAALQWVRDNVVAFGGNPGSVTIFGESAGGALVCSLLGSPAAAGLFRRAVVQSGTPERVRTASDAENVTAEFLEALNLREKDAERLLSAGVADIVAGQQAVSELHSQRTLGLVFPFQPTIGKPALPQPPVDAVRAGVNAEVDLLAGTNLNEASFVSLPLVSKKGANVAAMANSLVAPRWGADAYQRYCEALSAGLGRAVTDADVLESAMTDVLYRQPTNHLLDARLDGATGRTFAYLFTWRSPVLGGRLGAGHALDLPFVFRTLHSLEPGFCTTGDCPPHDLAEWMSGAWTRFARHGVPRADGLPDWPGYSDPDRLTMILDTVPMLRADPLGDLRRLWRTAALA